MAISASRPAARPENGSLNLTPATATLDWNAFFGGNAQLRATRLNSSDAYRKIRRRNKRQAPTTSSSKFNRQGYESGVGFDWSIDHRNTLPATSAMTFRQQQ